MQKIIIVNNNMDVGGVQKSLYNLLWTICDRYEVTLCLFKAIGPYINQLPPNIKVIECKGLARYMAVSQGTCVGVHKLMRGVLAAIARIFGRNVVMKLVLATEKKVAEHYDCAISYLQNGNTKSFYGGVQEFVLRKIQAEKKVAFLHCDYGNCGANHSANNRLMAEFDQIAACSDGCRRTFETIMPELAWKCTTVRNCHRIDEILRLADMDCVKYDANYRNVVMVSRLSHEKGIERALEAVAYGIVQDVPIMLHIVGNGPMRPMLEKIVAEKKIEKWVHFYGEQTNPYRYMKDADLLLMTSFHEAAPMVIDEAAILGLPVLTVHTTSSQEMVANRGVGWVCENDQEDLNRALVQTLSNVDSLSAIKKEIRSKTTDNNIAVQQFAALVEG